MVLIKAACRDDLCLKYKADHIFCQTYHSLWVQKFCQRQNNKPLLQANENAHNLQMGFLAYISPMKRLASLTKTGFNLKANQQNVNMRSRRQALHAPDSSLMEQQRMQRLQTSPGNPLDCDLFCDHNQVTSTSSFSDLKELVYDTGLFSCNVVSNAHCKSSPCLKLLHGGLGDVIIFLFMPLMSAQHY